LIYRSKGSKSIVDELNIARIRAYAATPALMPAERYTGRETPTKTNIEVVRLSLVNGLEGVASSISGWGGMKGGDVVRDIAEMSSRVVGQNITHREVLTESLLADACDGPWDAISVIDCAMWDAWARSVGKPLWKLLGGHRQSIKAYASTAAHLTLKEYLNDMRQLAGLGYGAIKFHMNTNLDFDLDMVHAVARADRDSGMRYMVDLEQCYTFDEAVKLGEAMTGLPFDWMEAPLPDDDLDAYVELNNAVAIDVLPAGNTLVGIDHWTAGLRRGAWSRLRCDATNAGGITTVLKSLELAQSMNIPVELQSHGFQPAQHANLSLVLGLEGCTWFEHPAPHEPYDYATRNPLTLDSRGCVSAAAGSGLGLDVDWQQIETNAFVTFDSLTDQPVKRADE
jgi:L-alanine-DL-glutamate epimerase-like enolase superfamily enzyme